MENKILTKEEVKVAGYGYERFRELIDTALSLYQQLEDRENKRKVLVVKWKNIYEEAKKDYFEHGIPDNDGMEMLIRRDVSQEAYRDLKGLGEGK